MKTLSDRIEDYCFFDFETRALPGAGEDGNLKTAGTYRYAKKSHPIILTYAIGQQPVQCVALDRGLFQDSLMLPPELAKFYTRAALRNAWFVAWNTGFDRAIWNNWQPGRPLAPEMTLDAMAQAQAGNLPADLQSASKAIGGAGKQEDGKDLIKIFTPEDGGTPLSHPAHWAQFKEYAIRDTEVLRQVFCATLKLPPREWQEYWASERVNERGVAIDIEYCEDAFRLAQANKEWSNNRLQALTGINGIRVTMAQQIANWVYDNLNSPVAKALLEVENAELDDAGESDDPADVPEDQPKNRTGLTLARSVVRRVINHLILKGELDDPHRRIVEVLELREYGGSSSPVKFRKAVDQQDGGRLKGQYVFNGAMQTGRFSSKGVQIHNLPRDSIGKLEAAAIMDIGLPVEDFSAKYGSAGKALPRLIKPALIAPEGKTLVWCDWSNIEARVNPWLAQSRSGDAKLDVFRASDRYPDQPDIYKMTAADLLGCAATAVTEAQRQSHGKVPELSLGFGGSTGALLNMASNYGVHIGDEQAVKMVEQWRENNPWAPAFWNKLWDAIESAMQTHKIWFRAGRVAYMYAPGLLGGALLCTLPDGRLLTYPQCRWEQNEVLNKVTGEKELRWQITYRKGHGRAAMWRGKACENVVQATAGSLLRDALVELREHEVWMPVVLHTHDDICVEVDEDRADEAGRILLSVMLGENEWNGGLPLAAEATTHWYLTKQDGRKISAFTEDRKRA